jgi:hypothetical protein
LRHEPDIGQQVIELIRKMGRQATEDVLEVREGIGTHEWLTAGVVRPSESPSFLLRASVRQAPADAE